MISVVETILIWPFRLYGKNNLYKMFNIYYFEHVIGIKTGSFLTLFGDIKFDIITNKL